MAARWHTRSRWGRRKITAQTDEETAIDLKGRLAPYTGVPSAPDSGHAVEPGGAAWAPRHLVGPRHLAR